MLHSLFDSSICVLDTWVFYFDIPFFRNFVARVLNTATLLITIVYSLNYISGLASKGQIQY